MFRTAAEIEMTPDTPFTTLTNAIALSATTVPAEGPPTIPIWTVE